MDPDRRSLVGRLRAAGFVAAPEEADELTAAAQGDDRVLEALVTRRLTGEPLAWIVGTTLFGGHELVVHPGVYVARPQSEPLAHRAAERLPATGVAVDLCTGSGAMAVILAARCPGARVLATDLDPRAVDCARANGVEAWLGDLWAPLPPSLLGGVDVVVTVVPYVPTSAMAFLPRDTLVFESRAAYDGGPDGTDLLWRAARESRPFLAPGGTLALELGGDQAGPLGDELDRLGYRDIDELRDEEGDVRGIMATLSRPA